MQASLIRNKRVVVIHWKNQKEDCFEVFSNLKNFCLSYPGYNYNTLNNYLSKEKIAYENDAVRIERKNIIAKPKQGESFAATKRSIVPVVRRVHMKDANDEQSDLEYWLSQPPHKRVEAATFIVSQSLKKDERMDRTVVSRKKLKG